MKIRIKILTSNSPVFNGDKNSKYKYGTLLNLEEGSNVEVAKEKIKKYLKENFKDYSDLEENLIKVDNGFEDYLSLILKFESNQNGKSHYLKKELQVELPIQVIKNVKG